VVKRLATLVDVERGITVRQGPRPLRKVLPQLLSSPPEALSPRLLRLIAELDQDWRHLDERLEILSAEIENSSENDETMWPATA
jgi:hypothetical protein